MGLTCRTNAKHSLFSRDERYAMTGRGLVKWRAGSRWLRHDARAASSAVYELRAVFSSLSRPADGERAASRVVNWCVGDTKSDRQQVHGCARHQAQCTFLLFEYEINEPSTKIQNPIDLDSDAMIAEVKKLRGKKKPLSLAGLRSLREEHEHTIVPTRVIARDARVLEQEVSDLINGAYGLTPAEVELMWGTSPPRMPISAPLSNRT
jgi:hypothetical protein